MSLERPALLWLFAAYVPLIVWYVMRLRRGNAELGVSSLASLQRMPMSWRVVMLHVCFALTLAAIGCVIVALCRPMSHDRFRTSQIEGTDIVLAVDISGSMLTRDFKPNRMEVAKDVAVKFINGRENDNMGLVVFAGESLSLMPLTTDRPALINAVKNVDMNEFADGTALGDGLASAINRIVPGHAKSKSIILMTDGTNNSGSVPPTTAAQIAAQKGIRVYTIGIGTNGSAQYVDPYGVATTIETTIDTETLKKIASMTGGKFFRATDADMLSEVFTEIERLEKSKLEVNNFTRADENYMPWAWAALALFSVVLLIRYTILRRIP